MQSPACGACAVYKRITQAEQGIAGWGGAGGNNWIHWIVATGTHATAFNVGGRHATALHRLIRCTHVNNLPTHYHPRSLLYIRQCNCTTRLATANRSRVSIRCRPCKIFSLHLVSSPFKSWLLFLILYMRMYIGHHNFLLAFRSSYGPTSYRFIFPDKGQYLQSFPTLRTFNVPAEEVPLGIS